MDHLPLLTVEAQALEVSLFVDRGSRNPQNW
jgi:hypothetical protein